MATAPTNPQQTHATAGKLAQLLGEVIIHHTPVTAQLTEDAKRRETERFLEGLEQHLAKQIGPFLQLILDESNPPPEIRSLIEEAIAPGAQFTAVIEQIFVFGIVSQLLGASIQPFLQGVTNDLWSSAVGKGIAVPVSPAIIATAAGRGLNLGDPPTLNVPDWAVSEAAKSGVSKADIDLQASLIGLPPALQELFELYRRGVIGLTPADGKPKDVQTGLREGDFRDDWIATVSQLAHGWLTPLDFVRAAVQSQMTYTDAKDWAHRTGLDTGTTLPLVTGTTEATPDMFGAAFSIAGRPPGPQELGRMALRGIIPWDGTGADALTFQQGIAESDVKTKWTDKLKALATYYPPAREIGTLLEKGAITEAQARSLWAAQGVPPTLVDGYVYMTQQQHITQDKLEAKGTVLTAYYDQIIDHPTAIGLLSDLGFRGGIADEMLAVTDFRREIQAINGVVKRISNLYANHKLTETDAVNALTQVGIPQAQVIGIISAWSALRSEPVRVPTVGEIGLAYKHGTIDEPTALAAIEALGYQPRDAAIVLSAHATTLITPLPPPGTTVTG